jgi:hypothetical protein
MRTGIAAGGIVLFILGLIGLGVGAFYASLAAEVLASVVTAIGAIVGGVGAALHSSRMKATNQQ